MTGRPLVVDASAVLDLLLQLRNGHHIGELLSSPFTQAYAPETIDREVMNVLRKHQHTGELTEAEAETAFAEYLLLPLEIQHARPLSSRAWQLRAFCSVGDAYYVALAEALETMLVTSDKKLARAVSSQLELDTLAP